MRVVYREKRYICGEYLDVFIYPVFETGKRNGKRVKRRPSTEAQRKLNQRHREGKLARLFHANFTPEDQEIHLTYRNQPENNKEAQRRLQNFIRRLKRYIARHGLGELKYIAVTERGKNGGRYHHHVTIHVEKGIDRDTLEQLWTEAEGNGYANSRRLQFNKEGLEGLARYVVKSPAGKKAWSASRNLIDPEPKTRDDRISGKKVRELAASVQKGEKFEKFERLYPGYLLSKAEGFHNDVNGGCYLEARFYKQDGVFISTKGRHSIHKRAKPPTATKKPRKRQKHKGG